MTFDDFQYLINNVLLNQEEPTVEDLILLVGTMVAFIAFILWCCFPVTNTKETPSHNHRQFSKSLPNPCLDYTQVHSSKFDSKAPINMHTDYIKNGHTYNCCS